MARSFEIITSLQYELKGAQRELASFKSGQKYVTMKKDHRSERCHLERIIRDLRKELHDTRYEQTCARQSWYESSDDMQKEYEHKIRKLLNEIEQLKEQNVRMASQRDQALNQCTELRREKYALAAELEKEKEKNHKLISQLNKDFENSSLPSSAQAARKKKIPNSRTATGRKPGAQPGHKGHGRKRQTPTRTVYLEPSTDVLNDPDFKKTKKTVTKQFIQIEMCLHVTEYKADVYRNSKTGELYHAGFPKGVTDDVNYGPSVRAFLFMLNHDCCVSIDKCREFLKDLTGGKLQLSKGMISRLSKEFAEKSRAEIKRVISSLYLSPVMHTDCTNVRVNGKNAYVYICAAPQGYAVYDAREKKGHAGVAGTVTEDYQGILVHDHEKTFFNYGGAHQECLAHVLRYLKGSMENEPERTWNKEMHHLIREMIHERNQKELDAAQVSMYKSRYEEILRTALDEYADIPCSDYYRDGYNLALRMKEYQEAHLLFLHNKMVPATNNLAERLLRGIKRKQNQAMSFRSFKNLEYLCHSMSMLFLMRQENGENIYDKVSEVFG